MKMKKIGKKMLACLLMAAVFATNVLPAAAKDNDVDARMKEVATNRQYYVYKLSKIMSDTELKMNSIVDEDFFDRKEGAGIWGILHFKDIAPALLGSDNYEASYYRKVMAECIMPGTAKTSDGIDLTLLGLVEDELYGMYEEMNEGKTVDDAFSTNMETAHNAFSVALDMIESTSEAGALLNKICNYSSSHLEALKLVKNNAKKGTSIYGSAKMVIDSTDSTSFEKAYDNFLKLFYLELGNGLIDASLSAITLGMSGFVDDVTSVVAGEMYEEEMNELFYLNFQNEIFSTYYHMTEKYPNVLKSQYSLEEIQDLTNLVLLYLRCGQLGFEAHFPKNAEACTEAYQMVLNLEYPYSVEKPAKEETPVKENTPTKEETPVKENTPTKEETPVKEIVPEKEVVTSNVVTISDYNLPNDISEGDYWRIYGTVNSNEIITNVTVEIEGNNGYIAASAEKVNDYRYDVANLDNQLTFNTLAPGKYSYTIWVETENMLHNVMQSSFEVKKEDGEMIIINYKLPQYLSVGDVFYVKGNVKSKSSMSSVTVEIVDEAGNFMTGGTATGNYTTYDLKNLDKYVEFNKVPAGAYRYIIKAINAYGEEVLVDQSYMVR